LSVGATRTCWRDRVPQRPRRRDGHADRPDAWERWPRHGCWFSVPDADTLDAQTRLSRDSSGTELFGMLRTWRSRQGRRHDRFARRRLGACCPT
jgi:hypothetical protein